MMHMLDIEIRRCFSRRLVRGLIAVAVVGCVGTAYFAHRTAMNAPRYDPFQLAELHETTGDTFLGVGAFFLLIGAVVGGASMVGAEWRAGTFVTLLTWEPNRRRVAVAKLLACGLVATAIAVVLLALFTAAFLPATLGPGTTEGMDAGVVALGGGRDRADRVPHGVGGDVRGVGGDARTQHGGGARRGLRLPADLREPAPGLEAVGRPVPRRRERRDLRERGRPRHRDLHPVDDDSRADPARLRHRDGGPRDRDLLAPRPGLVTGIGLSPGRCP